MSKTEAKIWSRNCVLGIFRAELFPKLSLLEQVGPSYKYQPNLSGTSAKPETNINRTSAKHQPNLKHISAKPLCNWRAMVNSGLCAGRSGSRVEAVLALGARYWAKRPPMAAADPQKGCLGVQRHPNACRLTAPR
jgi:hypothetical protein